jgi:putative ABC transport system substrate-binding protein
VRVEYGWGAGDANRFRRYAAELVALAPDVAPASGTLSVLAFQQANYPGPIGTLSVLAFQQANYPGPIVFTLVSDPVGAGFVDSLARPGGNITGFMLSEYSMSGKWLELLKEVAPGVTRAAVLRDSANPAASAQFGAIQAVAPSPLVQ